MQKLIICFLTLLFANGALADSNSDKNIQDQARALLHNYNGTQKLDC